MFTAINKRARRNLWHWFTKLAFLGGHKPNLQRVHARHAKTHVSPRSFDRLEDRLLLACDAWIDTGDLFNPADDYLRVEGDAAANVIEIWWDGVAIAADVDCSPQTEYFDDDAIPGGIVLRGFAGNDRITVDSSVTIKVLVEGGDGNDTMTGGSGNDTILGGNHNDQIYGGAGSDSLQGDGGNDTMDGGNGADVFDGGAGVDTADYSARTVNLVIDLDDFADDGATGEKDNVKSSVENVWGGSGNDKITGSSAANELKGNGGKDKLYGQGGSDSLYGGDLADSLYGGSGDHYLYGGKGNDFLRGDSGSDYMAGEWGNDTLQAVDNTWDTVDGGPDSDACSADGIDAVLNCSP